MLLIAATFTADPVRPVLRFLLDQIGIDEPIELVSFGQVFQELLGPTSSFARNKKGINVVLIRLEDWAGEWEGIDPDEVIAKVLRGSEEFAEAVAASTSRSSAPHVVCICAPSLSFLAMPERAAANARITDSLVANLRSTQNVSVITTPDIAELYDISASDDPISYRLGKVPYTPRYYAGVGALVARRVHAIRYNPYKVIVLDCDNTLWTGVVGEDGVAGITLGIANLELQRFVVAQQRAGMLLCICSKNNEPDVEDVFTQRTDMVLRREHIVAQRINWRPKSQNIRELAQELNLGLDSFIFLDDDSAVCAEVRANCPEVLTVHLSNVDQVARTLRHLWAFDRMKTTSEDARRTELYRGNVERERVRKNAPSFEDFLKGLELRIDIEPIVEEDIPRVSQLTLRTNQFNFTTIRRSESELRELLSVGGHEGLTIRVKDRFGDYGLVAAVLYRVETPALVVETFLLSCRVLGRGVEHTIIARLGAIAREKNLARVDLHFRRSTKNQVARQFLTSVFADWCQSAGEESVYGIPTEIAQSFRCRESISLDLADETSAVSSNAVTTQSLRAAGLFRIAAELYEVQAILDSTHIVTAAAGSTPIGGDEMPRDQLETSIAVIWEEILGVSQIGRTAEFEDVGGDSLMAVRLFARIEETLGVSLPLTTIMETRTIAALADVLRKHEKRAPTACLVPLQPRGSMTPLYCMHAAGGNVLFYRDLARHLGPEQPVYGFQAYGLDGRNPPHVRVEDMAHHYIREMREFQPNGPYFLCGSSFGGLVAFEMARQLERQGQSVGMLALFDTYGPNYPVYLAPATSIKRKLYRIAQRVHHHWSDLRLLPNGKRLAYIAAKAHKARNQFRRKWKRNRNDIARKFLEKTGRPLPVQLRKTQNSISLALSRYQFGPYSGNIILYRASNQPIGIEPNPTLGWESIHGARVEAYEVPGFHGAITVDPHAFFLAMALQPRLERAMNSTNAAKRDQLTAIAS